VCDNRVARAVGDVTYTQALNRRGGIEADFTVTRVAAEVFSIVTGTAFGSHDMAWLRKQARRGGTRVRIEDVTGRDVCYALWGPRSRKILARLTPADLSNEVRVTFVGELGWELYASSEFGAALWRDLWSAGVDLGLVAGGYRAIDSMRLEKGYRVWGTDITPETTPYEAGLGFCVKLGKPGGFEGRDALVACQERGPERRLCAIMLHDPGSVVLGNEPVRIGDRIVGRVTSGGYGYSVDASIAYAYLPVAGAEPGTTVSVDLFGDWIDGVVAAEPLFDPAGSRIRAS
jgi:glycine cleavage system aminomethyltransferase T